MKIIIPKKISKIIFAKVDKHSPKEVKGALFAKKINESTFEIDAVYIEPKVGSFVFVELFNNRKFKQFQKKYHKLNNYNYEQHNYIGDWHSHPSFALIPSSFDKIEVKKDLEQGNAEFLIQIIVKVKNEKIIGNAFLYNKNFSAKRIKLVIEQP